MKQRFEKGDYVSVRIHSDAAIIGSVGIKDIEILYQHAGFLFVGKVCGRDLQTANGLSYYYIVDLKQSMGFELSVHEHNLKHITEKEYFKKLLAGPKQDSKEEKL